MTCLGHSQGAQYGRFQQTLYSSLIHRGSSRAAMSENSVKSVTEIKCQNFQKCYHITTVFKENYKFPQLLRQAITNVISAFRDCILLSSSKYYLGTKLHKDCISTGLLTI